VPEEAETQEAVPDVFPESLGEKLGHHRAEPQEARRDVQPWHPTRVKKKTGMRCGGACAPRDEAGELLHLQGEECRAQHPGGDQRQLSPHLVAFGHRKARHAAGKTRCSRHAVSSATLPVRRAGPPWGRIRRAGQHGVRREEGEKHDDVGEEKEPEAITDYDCRDAALRNQPLRPGVRPGQHCDQPAREFLRAQRHDVMRLSFICLPRVYMAQRCSARFAVGSIDPGYLLGRDRRLADIRQANTTNVT